MSRKAYSLKHMVLCSIKQIPSVNKMINQLLDLIKRRNYQKEPLYPDGFPPEVIEKLSVKTFSYGQSFIQKNEVAIYENIGYYH